MILPSRDMRNWGVGAEAVTYGQRDTISLRQIADKYRIRTIVGDHRPGMTSAQQVGILAPLNRCRYLKSRDSGSLESLEPQDVGYASVRLSLFLFPLWHSYDAPETVLGSSSPA